jgi:hypothetical protein
MVLVLRVPRSRLLEHILKADHPIEFCQRVIDLPALCVGDFDRVHAEAADLPSALRVPHMLRQPAKLG